MYLTYTEYQEYGGTLVSPEQFDSLELKARLVLDNFTLKPSLTLDLLKTRNAPNIKMTMLELIDNLHREQESLLQASQADVSYYGGIVSESVKDHSVSFKTDGSSQIKVSQDYHNLRHSIMKQYLLFTGLLARGL